MESFAYAVFVVSILFAAVVGFDLWRQHRRERRARNSRPWQAISPSAKFIVATTDELEAVKLIGSMGKVAFIDREQRIIFFDTQLGGGESSPVRRKAGTETRVFFY